MAGAVRSGMDVTVLGARIAAVTARRARHVAGTRRQRLEDRVESVDDIFRAADHHAVAAFESPDAAAGANVDMMDVALFKSFGAADIVLPECVAAVDNDVAGVQQPSELDDDIFGNFSGRQHDPDNARRTKLPHEFVETCRSSRAGATQFSDGLGVMVVDDGLMPVLHQSARDVSAHSTETDNADLH